MATVFETDSNIGNQLGVVSLEIAESLTEFAVWGYDKRRELIQDGSENAMTQHSELTKLVANACTQAHRLRAEAKRIHH